MRYAFVSVKAAFMNKTESVKTHKGLFGAVTVLLILWAVMWYSGVLEGDSRMYEVRPEIRPEIRIPEYRSDAARAIDAYERLMDRYMTLNERSLGDIGADLKGINRKLDSIDRQIRGLSERIGGIEAALGIEPPRPVAPEKKPFGELEDKDEAMPLPGGAGLPEVAERVGGSDSHSL